LGCLLSINMRGLIFLCLSSKHCYLEQEKQADCADWQFMLGSSQKNWYQGKEQLWRHIKLLPCTFSSIWLIQVAEVFPHSWWILQRVPIAQTAHHGKHTSPCHATPITVLQVLKGAQPMCGSP
jgi:hypothetical protein